MNKNANPLSQRIVDVKEGGKIKEINSASILSILPEADTSDNGVFFRGESKNYIETKGSYISDTRLQPSVFRGADEKKDYYDALTNFPQEFSDLSNLSKLAKMQHYNYPTRLLDLTTNPLVALWFACSDYSRYRKIVIQNEREDGYFFVVKTKVENVLTCDSDKALLLSCLAKLDDKTEKPELLKVLQYAIDQDVDISETIISDLRQKSCYEEGAKIFAKYIGEATRERAAFSRYRTVAKHLLSTFIVRPMVENERQRKQEGLFAIFGMQDDKINNTKEFTIKRYLVPKDSKDAIIKQLDKLGINEATLFGDLESRASYNRSKEETLKVETDKKQS